MSGPAADRDFHKGHSQSLGTPIQRVFEACSYARGLTPKTKLLPIAAFVEVAIDNRDQISKRLIGADLRID